MKKSTRMLTTVAYAAYTNGLRATSETGASSGPARQTLRESSALLADSALINVNKASRLLGMEIENHVRERLGRIDDIVFNLASATVAYVVLDHGGFWGLGEKKVGVLWNAFTVNQQQDRLLLNLTKDQVRRAKGLRKDQWPCITDPAWRAEMIGHMAVPTLGGYRDLQHLRD